MAFSLMLLIALVMAFSFGRRRRDWNDWRYLNRYPPLDPDPRARSRVRDSAYRTAVDGPMADYVESLETRVARLEERLDFTEQLLSERSARRRIADGTAEVPPSDR